MQVKILTETDYRKKTINKRKSSASVQPLSENSFLNILEEVLPSSLDENKSLHELWSILPDAEKDLIETPSNENLNHYKDVVRQIASQTISMNVRLKKIYRKNRNNEKVELNVIEYLDSRIQKMAVMMQSSGNTAFNILKTLDEIRGILLDLKR
ncbi:MAG: YaaR family protein [Spirochaetia bacterium]|nr:YaaR family protein [Spirochaetia bacterium]